MKHDLDAICSIFYSGGYAFTGARDSAQDIAFLVEESYLSLERMAIATIEQYRVMLANTSVIEEAYEADGGSREHVVLKLLAADYMKQHYRKTVRFEQELCGYVADALTEDRQIAIECGHTQNAEKLLGYFEQAQIRQLMQIPYPSSSDEYVFGYLFSAGPDLYEFLAFLSKERRHKLKQQLSGS
jgi:hypothetical protein